VKHLEPTVAFDYAGFDPAEPNSFDAAFWSAQAAFLADILAWITTARDLNGMGARVATLVLYLRPQLLNQTSLREISKLPNAPTAAALSKAMIELQERYSLHLGNYQKPAWARERYRRSAIVAHQASGGASKAPG
jgi:hypothetical protein